MDPSYEMVVDTMDLVWTMFAYLTHGVVVFVHATVACFLLATGALEASSPGRAGRWLRRLGATRGTRPLGLLRIALGLGMFAPLALALPVGVSLAPSLAASGFLLWVESSLSSAERPVGSLMRRAAIGGSALAALFMVWEGEDNLALGADLLVSAREWRNEELHWQLDADRLSPKVGDLAPDFELQDPEGVTRVRLSDFRGKRPVALVFGSYT